MTLQITITEEKDMAIVELAGKVDGFSAAELQQGFKHVREMGKREIILLLKGLEYIDSRGIGAFLSFFKAIKDGGGRVRLAEAPPNILELFNVLGVEDLAEVYPSLEQALENSGEGRPTEEVQRKAAGEEDERHLPKGVAPSSHKAPYVLVGAAVLIAVILVFLFLKPAKRTSGTESEMGPRLDLLERRIAQIEGRLDAPSPAEETVERLSKGFSERFSLIEKDLSRMREDLAALEKKGATAVIPEKEKAPPAPPAYHIVSRGETLYRIALLYNMTVEELRRLNDLKSDQPLLVGQRLRVKAQ